MRAEDHRDTSARRRAISRRAHLPDDDATTPRQSPPRSMTKAERQGQPRSAIAPDWRTVLRSIAQQALSYPRISTTLSSFIDDRPRDAFSRADTMRWQLRPACTTRYDPVTHEGLNDRVDRLTGSLRGMVDRNQVRDGLIAIKNSDCSAAA